MSESKKDREMHRIAKTARKLIGRKGASQKDLAEWTGVHHTVISRRETGKLAITGTTAEQLYKVVEALCVDGLNLEVEECLVGLPEPRSEDKALMAVILLAFEHGRAHLVQQIIENKSPTKASKKAFDVANTLRVITVLRADLEEQAMQRARDGDPSAGYFQSAAKTLSGSEAELRMLRGHIQADAEDRRKAEAQKNSNGKPPDS